MKLLVAIHGILTSQTNASWPDALAAFMARRDPQIAVLKKEYRAGPFPRFNHLITDPLLARELAADISAFGVLGSAYDGSSFLVPGPDFPEVWFLSHSNGAVIALHTMRRLVAMGLPIAGAIFTGAAIQADVDRSGLASLVTRQASPRFISWSSRGDRMLDGTPEAGEGALRKIRDWIWGRAMWPYGSLGYTGWRRFGAAYESPEFLNRWCPVSWGHSGYWDLVRRRENFEVVYKSIQT